MEGRKKGIVRWGVQKVKREMEKRLREWKKGNGSGEDYRREKREYRRYVRGRKRKKTRDRWRKQGRRKHRNKCER